MWQDSSAERPQCMQYIMLFYCQVVIYKHHCAPIRRALYWHWHLALLPGKEIDYYMRYGSRWMMSAPRSQAGFVLRCPVMGKGVSYLAHNSDYVRQTEANRIDQWVNRIKIRNSLIFAKCMNRNSNNNNSWIVIDYHFVKKITSISL